MMFTEPQSQILSILLENPQKEFYLSLLGQLLNKHPGVFQNSLKALEKKGLILSRRHGNQRLIRINPDHPLYPEVRSIIQKTFGIEGRLRQMVQKIKGVRTALIYGSYAKDKMRAESDIDLLVVLGQLNDEEELLVQVGKSERMFGREINYKVYSAPEFRKKLENRDPFLKEILSEPTILLKGELP